MKLSEIQKKDKEPPNLLMRLSEIFGWEKKKAIPFKHVPETCSYCTAAWNDSLTSCDREIDREALAKALYSFEYTGTKWEEADGWEKVVFLGRADNFISTMPQWLKRIDNGKI